MPGARKEYFDRLAAEQAEADEKARLIAGIEGANPTAVPLPAWSGQAPSQPYAPAQPPVQAPSQPYAPPQLALGAPIGAVSPVRVNNQALINALRAPAAPQASGGSNG